MVRKGMEGHLAGANVSFLFAVILVVTAAALMFPLRWWMMARAAGVDVPLLGVLLMRLRGTKPHRILAPLIAASRAGLELDSSDLEALHLAGGNVMAVVDALILAREHGIDLDFRRAVAIDLSGRDVLEEVNAAIGETEHGRSGTASTPAG
ncbi:MAG: flotillin-like FloA family protein [Gemmatimonadales bacterium]|jgi:uncharacterized protein YqfA (UPF0365 family)